MLQWVFRGGGSWKKCRGHLDYQGTSVGWATHGAAGQGVRLRGGSSSRSAGIAQGSWEHCGNTARPRPQTGHIPWALTWEAQCWAYGEMPAGLGAAGISWAPLALESSTLLWYFHIILRSRGRAQLRANNPANAVPNKANSGSFPYLCLFCTAAGNS